MKTMIALGLVASLMVPLAFAGDEVLETPVPVGGKTYYVDDQSGYLFQETNGLDGLQRRGIDTNQDGEIDIFPDEAVIVS